MFQRQNQFELPKSSALMAALTSFGKPQEDPEERINLRLDLLSHSLEARLPQRGYIRH